MNPQIKNRYTGAVIYEGESGMTMRQMLEKATGKKVNLRGADLHRANLYGANLYGVNLYEADLRGADLHRANLYEADLRGADLRGANLYEADLRGANLRGANLYEADLYEADLRGADLRGVDLYRADLRGADLGERFGKLVGERPHMTIGPIGSRAAYLQLWLCEKGAFVRAGCFFDTLGAFAAAVEKVHGDSDHAKEYQMAILMMETHAVLWTPKEK